MKKRFVLRLNNCYYKDSSKGLITITENLSEARVFANLPKLKELVLILNCGLIIERIEDGKLVAENGPRKIIIDDKIKTTTFDDQDGDIIEYIR